MDKTDDPIPVDHEPITEDNYDGVKKAEEAAGVATGYCSGVISRTSGNRCSNSECQTLMGKTMHFKCEGGDCPIKPNKWYTIPHACTPGGTKWLSGCNVQFNNITGCS